MTSSLPNRVRTLPDRSNDTIDVLSPADESPVRLHLKRHTAQRVRRTPSLGHGPIRAGVAAGIHEADAVGACQRAGVPVMRVVAAGQQATEDGRRADSFFISEDLRGALPAEEYWARHVAADDLTQRQAVLDALARAAARLHGAGLFHRDLYWCHFMVTPPASSDAQPEVAFIDLQRLHRPRLAGYARMKDLAQFMVSAPPGPLGPSPNEMRGWYARYLNQEVISGRQRVMLAVIRVRAGFYRIKGIKP
jgi:hypothetical protein